MKRILYAAAAALVLAAGCAKEIDREDGLTTSVSLSVGIDQQDTKVAFASDKTFQWQTGDQVGVYISDGSFVPFTLASAAGKSQGTFTGAVPAGQTYGTVAVYPYNEGTSCSGGTLTFHLPEYYRDLGDLSRVMMPMAASLGENASEFTLRHVGGAVKVTLTNVPEGAKYFKLTADKPITGDFKVSVADLANNAVLSGTGTGYDVELQLSAGKAQSSLDIYFPVPAGTYTFSIGVYGDGVTYLQKAGTTSNTVGRGTILRMPALEIPEIVYGTSDWTVIGSFNNTAWGYDVPMDLDGDWSVAKDLTLTASDEFKFRRDRSWTTNFGVGTSPTTVSLDTRLVLSQDGGNMKVSAAGSYDLYLNADAAVAYVLKAGSTFTHKDDETPDNPDYNPDLEPSKKLGGITYQLNVYSFADSNNDLRGDFNGIRNHMDYLDKLGVTAIWLSPIQRAQSYHGYDVTDYSSVNSAYGTEGALKNMIKEAHKYNIRVYMDYVINHTGNEHVWFKDVKANGPSSQYWNYYSISTDPQADVNNGKIAQIPAGWYDQWSWYDFTYNGTKYWYYSAFNTGVFADLNYSYGSNCENSPAFQAVVLSIDKWLDMGIDGLRLDAVKHIYADENGQDNILFWQKFYDAVNAKYKSHSSARADLVGKQDGNIFMVGEVLSGESVCRRFYAGLPAIFEFDFWWQLRDALKSESANYFVDNMCDRYYRHQEVRADAIPTPKLSNHDETRAATELYDAHRLRQAAAILLTAPGRPFIYQGEELGYWGTKDNGDEYVRAPIMWTNSISGAATAGVNNKYDSSMLTAERSVPTMEADPNSLLMLYRHFGYARNVNPALADGHPIFDSKTTDKVLSWYMEANDGSGKKCLVMHNIGGAAQSIGRDGDNLTTVLVKDGNVTVSGSTVNMPAYSSVVFALN